MFSEINLLVIKVNELVSSVKYYEKLGFKFIQECHGNGPVHYSAQCVGFVIELYIGKPAGGVVGGLRVDNLVSFKKKCETNMIIFKPIGNDILIEDPDHNKLIISK